MSDISAEDRYADPQGPLTRLQFIVDVVFAIAMVAFAITYPMPEVEKTAADPLRHLLSEMALDLVSLALTYAVVAMYWYKHTMQFNYRKRLDTGQVVLQLTSMFGILLLPLSVWLTLALPDFKLSYVIHNVNLVWLGFFSIIAWNQATRDNRLVDKDLPAEVVTSVRKAALLEPTVMVIGIFAALIGPVWWMLSFLLLLAPALGGRKEK